MILDIMMLSLVVLGVMLIEEYYRSPYLKEYLKGKVMALVLSFSIVYRKFFNKF
jgi:hypothetical protein